MVRSVENLMIVIKEVPPGTPPREGVEVTKNVDFATFAKTARRVSQAQARHSQDDRPADHRDPSSLPNSAPTPAASWSR